MFPKLVICALDKVIYELKRNKVTQKHKGAAALVRYMTFATRPIFLLHSKIKGILSYIKFVTKYIEVCGVHR